MKKLWLGAFVLVGCANNGQHSDSSSHATAAEPSLAGWTALETSSQGTPAKWSALRGADGAVQFRVESTNGDQTYNLLVSEAAHGPDLAIATRIHADAGEIDQGGGLIWRARDASNYYVARWNPLEDNVRAYFVRDGVRKQLASAATELDPTAWHDFAVRMDGTRITVAIDGREYLSLDDGTFASAGKIGLWTKADASTTFAMPTVETLGH